MASFNTTRKNERLFNSPLIKRFSPGSVDDEVSSNEIVYHYTSPEAFLSIIRSHTLRFTDIHYLNDKSEGIYFTKLLLDFMDEYHDKYPLFNEVVNKLLSGNDYEKIRELDTTAVNYSPVLGQPYKERLFVFCACKDPDSLNMWNYYVNNGSYQGYNIGFRTANLLKAFDVPDPSVLDAFTVYYGNVIYDSKKQISEIERLAEWHESRLRYNSAKTHSKFTREHAQYLLYSYIHSYGLFYKHQKFKSEDEFRIVIEIYDDRVPCSKEAAQKYFGEYNKSIEKGFCCKQGLIVPYLSISFPEKSIYRITLAPMLEFDIAKSSIRELLSMSGIEKVRVDKSSIPIRF